MIGEACADKSGWLVPRQVPTQCSGHVRDGLVLIRLNEGAQYFWGSEKVEDGKARWN